MFAELDRKGKWISNYAIETREEMETDEVHKVREVPLVLN